MKEQNYKNHIRYYTQHHFVFYPVILILFSACIYGFTQGHNKLLWLVLTVMVTTIGWLSFMLRQHYALGNQNRIARLELRFRYYVATHKRLEEIEHKLSLSHILALRFAPDEELETLIQKTIAENLSPDAIKRAVKNWLPDPMRL